MKGCILKYRTAILLVADEDTAHGNDPVGVFTNRQ